MNKNILRVIFCNILIIYLVAIFAPFSISIDSNATLTLNQRILFLWGILSALGILYFIICLFYNWGTNKFRKKSYKLLWFWTLLIGTFLYGIGPILYWIIVYEMKRGLEKDE